MGIVDMGGARKREFKEAIPEFQKLMMKKKSTMGSGHPDMGQSFSQKSEAKVGGQAVGQIGEMPEVRASPKVSAMPFGCLNLLWEDIQTDTEELSLIQHEEKEIVIDDLGFDSPCDLALEILFHH